MITPRTSSSTALPMMMHTELQAVLRQRQSRSRNFSKQSNDYTDDEDLGLPKSLQNSPGKAILNNGFIISVNMGNFQVIFPMTWWGARSYGRVDPGVLAGITAPAATTPFSASTATTTRLTMMSGRAGTTATSLQETCGIEACPLEIGSLASTMQMAI